MPRFLSGKSFALLNISVSITSFDFLAFLTPKKVSLFSEVIFRLFLMLSFLLLFLFLSSLPLKIDRSPWILFLLRYSFPHLSYNYFFSLCPKINHSRRSLLSSSSYVIPSNTLSFYIIYYYTH